MLTDPIKDENPGQRKPTPARRKPFETNLLQTRLDRMSGAEESGPNLRAIRERLSRVPWADRIRAARGNEAQAIMDVAEAIRDVAAPSPAMQAAADECCSELGEVEEADREFSRFLLTQLILGLISPPSDEASPEAESLEAEHLSHVYDPMLVSMINSEQRRKNELARIQRGFDQWREQWCEAFVNLVIPEPAEASRPNNPREQTKRKRRQLVAVAILLTTMMLLAIWLLLP